MARIDGTVYSLNLFSRMEHIGTLWLFQFLHALRKPNRASKKLTTMLPAFFLTTLSRLSLKGIIVRDSLLSYCAKIVPVMKKPNLLRMEEYILRSLKSRKILLEIRRHGCIRANQLMHIVQMGM